MLQPKCVCLVCFRTIGAPVTCPVGAKPTTLMTSLTAWRLCHRVGNTITHHAIKPQCALLSWLSWGYYKRLHRSKGRKSLVVVFLSYIFYISRMFEQNLTQDLEWLQYLIVSGCGCTKGKCRTRHPSCEACAWQTLYSTAMYPGSMPQHVPTTTAVLKCGYIVLEFHYQQNMNHPQPP